jgi:Na+:H+ antiporter, NhaA family
MVGPPSHRSSDRQLSMRSTIPSPSTVPSRKPPEAWGPFLRLAHLAGLPLERFLRVEAASGIVLLMAAAIALAWANSLWGASYASLWHTTLGLRIGAFTFERSLEWFVNDVLMVIFFFVVGLEIRREIHHGELSEWRRAALPAAAAIGGMIAPALLYLGFASAPATRSGWGVPMATDIAFAVGILTLVGKRVPAALRVLLLALAVIDDLGAIVVIAAFYSSGIALSGVLVAMTGIAAIFVMQRFGVRSKAVYIAPAAITWAGIYAAGIHPTIAGVIIGLITPVRAWYGREGFIERVRQELLPLRDVASDALSSHELARSLRQVDLARREAMSPAESLIELLHPWVAYGIMPLFALANAGVSLKGLALDSESVAVVSGVVTGLVLGKPLGVLLAIWITTKLGIGSLPLGLNRRHLLVLGVVAGVGFTMALFVAQLAFTELRLLAAAKLGVLAASGLAAVVALVLGRSLLTTTVVEGAAECADEAEQSTLA